MVLNKFNNLKVNLGAKSSRFVVDLKQDSATTEAKELKNKKEILLESKLEKLAELDYKKYFGTGKEKAKTMAANFKNIVFKIGASALSLSKMPVSKPSAVRGRKRGGTRSTGLADQLFFVFLAKLIFVTLVALFRWIYKVCYGVGWTIVFILRLIYLILRGIIRPFVRGLNYLFKKFLSSISFFFKPLALVADKLGRLPISKGSEAKRINSALAVPTADYKEARNKGYFKPAVAFAGVLLILVLPVKAYTYYKTIDSAKGRVLGASESAMDNLISGGQAAANLDFSLAGQSFTSAGDNFLTAEHQLDEINGLLFTIASIVPDKNIQLAAASKHMVKAGEFSAAAGKDLSSAASGILNYQAGNNKEILADLSVYGHKAMVDLAALTNELEQINSSYLPDAYQEKFILLKLKTAEINRGLGEVIGLADNLKSFTGDGKLKRYLLVFQNNSELRASGGFIGSYAIVDFLNGKIKNIEVPGGGSYDTDGGLTKKIKSPEPLSLVRPDWHFWDANWWPDWPTSAAKLAWFYENSGGSTVDGVIGLTPTVMEKILKVIGPIDLKEKYGVVIDADNFWLITQQFAEQKPDVTNQPKKIIGDLMNKIVEQLPSRLNKNNLIGLMKAVEESLTDKNILLYFTDDELETKAKTMGWDGRIKETSGDYLSVVNTNIAGGKSDRTIKQQISHRAEIQPDGTIIDNLTIVRTHEAVNRQPFSGVRNVDWLRIYVPLGSKLISASGFKPVDKIFFKEADPNWLDDPDIARTEGMAVTDSASETKIYNESNKTVFANWSQVDPGESVEISLKYQLPFKLTDKNPEEAPGLASQIVARASEVINPAQKNFYLYSLLAQKQPGMNSSTISSELKLSDNFKSIWNLSGASGQNQNGWFMSDNFDQDKLMALIAEER